VAFRVCGISEVIQNDETGYVVEQGNIEALAEKLIFLAKNPELAKKMGDKAKLKVRKLYTLERMVEKKLQFYESIFEQKPLTSHSL